MVLEGTSNPLRSKSFHDMSYGNMAENTLADQVSGMQQLAKRYAFIDLERVGIWGHSGGGFATAGAMFHVDQVTANHRGSHPRMNRGNPLSAVQARDTRGRRGRLALGLPVLSRIGRWPTRRTARKSPGFLLPAGAGGVAAARLGTP